MKYTIEISCRPNYLRMYRIDKKMANRLKKDVKEGAFEPLQEAFGELEEERYSEYDIEKEVLYNNSRFLLIVKDEQGNTVFECKDYDYLEQECLSFEGVTPGTYLMCVQEMRGHSRTGELELSEPFDKNKIYLLRDNQIDESLIGQDVLNIYSFGYRCEYDPDIEKDLHELEFISDLGDASINFYVAEVNPDGEWKIILEEEA